MYLERHTARPRFHVQTHKLQYTKNLTEMNASTVLRNNTEQKTWGEVLLLLYSSTDDDGGDVSSPHIIF